MFVLQNNENKNIKKKCDVTNNFPLEFCHKDNLLKPEFQNNTQLNASVWAAIWDLFTEFGYMMNKLVYRHCLTCVLCVSVCVETFAESHQQP